jgi:hypothetical protein
MSDSLRAAKIVLFMGAGAGLVGIVRSIPPVQLEAFSSIINISGTLAGFSAPWLLPAFGIFALVSRDRHERRDFRGSGSSGFFSGSVKTGEIIPGNTDLGGWLANYWLMIYPMVMAYYNHARFPFMKGG